MATPTVNDIGRKAKDVITGFEGTITGCAIYITGCNQYLVQPVPTKRGEQPADPRWLDENRLQLRPGKPVVLEPLPSQRTGACEAAPAK